MPPYRPDAPSLARCRVCLFDAKHRVLQLVPPGDQADAGRERQFPARGVTGLAASSGTAGSSEARALQQQLDDLFTQQRSGDASGDASGNAANSSLYSSVYAVKRSSISCGPLTGVCIYKIESNNTPQSSDFSVLEGAIEGPDSEWEFIDSIYHKGTKLEITSYLDSDCKVSDIHIYSN